MAQLGEDGSVPRVDHSSSSNLQGYVEALEAVANDGGGQLLVQGGFFTGVEDGEIPSKKVKAYMPQGNLRNPNAEQLIHNLHFDI